MQTLPIDGSSMPLTSDVMTRLQAMTLYPQSLASIMASLGDGNWNPGRSANAGSSMSIPTMKTFDVGADGNQLLAHYIMDTMETLLTSLESKGRVVIRTKALMGVFMANNVALWIA